MKRAETLNIISKDSNVSKRSNLGSIPEESKVSKGPLIKPIDTNLIGIDTFLHKFGNSKDKIVKKNTSQESYKL